MINGHKEEDCEVLTLSIPVFDDDGETYVEYVRYFYPKSDKKVVYLEWFKRKNKKIYERHERYMAQDFK